jgi:two-component system, OmpR family, response regulator
MTTCCPTCGQAIEAGEAIKVTGRYVLHKDKATRLSKMEAAVVSCLLEAKGRVVTKDHIMQHVYGLACDWPDWKILDIFICRARRRLKPLGIFIANSRGEGFALGVEK